MSAKTADKAGKNGAAPAHFSESWLLGFYFGEVSPRLDRRLVWPDLRELKDRLEDAACAGCKRTETFTYPDSQFLICSHRNSCGRRESILSKLSGVEHPSGERLLEAIREAARLAGVLFPKRDATPEEQEQARLWGQRKDCLESTAAWCETELWSDSDAAKAALDYLRGRGFQDNHIRDLQLGYFSKTDDLRKKLKAEKLSLEIAGSAALFMGNLEGYVVFPWRDEHGNLLTLYGRWPGSDLPLRAVHPGRWKEDAGPTIPKTYALPGEGTKADPLYFDRVKRARHKEVVLVEGVIDAAIAQVRGDTRVCAYVAGTLSGKQIEALVRYRPNAVIACPDPDEGGDKGVLSTVNRLGEAQVRAYVAPRLPDEQDPDEFILKHGIGEWKSFLEHAIPAPVFLAQKAIGVTDRTMPTKLREEVLRKVVDIIAGLDGEGASIDKTTIVQMCSTRLGYAKREIQAELAQRRKTQRDSGKPTRPALREVQHTKPQEGADSWRSRLMWTETQTGAHLTRNLANALTILSHHPEWKGVLAFDEFAQKVVALQAPPSHGKAFEPKRYPHKWGDHDDALAAAWLQRGEPVLDVDVKVTARALEVVSQLCRVHPVREYLNALAWDGVYRLRTWLEVYAGAELGPGGRNYLAEVGLKWMVAAVARIFEPGCKVDSVIVFEGEQGIRKSTAFRILGDPWFTDELSDVGSKDAAVQLQGVWIVELAELDALSKAESAKIKSFFTRRVERYVPKYARHALEVPRQCVFAGTVNPDTYLKDETGNRRFWPVKCTNIDVESLKRDRDQLWSEAVHLYRAGAQWHLDSAIAESAKLEQDSRYQEEVWEPLIRGYITDRQRASVPEILTNVVNKKKADWTQNDQNRVARSLKHIGWERKKIRIKLSEANEPWATGSDGGFVYVYQPQQKAREPGDET